MKKRQNNRILRFFKYIYLKLFRTNDSPQKIAFGTGLGVFSGIIPGTGPIAALFLAFLFRANRAAALIASLITNTWLSIVTFLLSIKIGSAIMKVSGQDVYQNWKAFPLPVIVGYFVVALALGISVYLITLLILTQIKHAKNKSRINFSR